ncbi:MULTISPECIES: ribosome hibernation-promoting factor, HPF/YfiA family [Methylobacillus]|uniref:Ribosome hibernation promoting factor n=1 Tax=Methylobacillus flagellatus (strain ATCC 51484 / DSM 6875 / VKM B-1610 / KT) TaxID=265072 RepID=Q1H523_METFK|nr:MULTISPECIES: ribosome-associated translation inhibitor RaiA [Methylobacillus]ABE48414.1 SSU ribosomal protein S30P [Methylobacillus flagellatus KT]MPS48209.1 ribosome-associated translation inhibitor RaiA [Methylobacillus sp.]
MNLHLTGHHLEVTPALREYVQSKLARLSNHFDHVIDLKVTLSVEKLVQKAEATLHVPGNDLHAECGAENMYSAIDLLADKLDRQVLKHKEKISNHNQASGGLKHQPVE